MRISYFLLLIVLNVAIANSYSQDNIAALVSNKLTPGAGLLPIPQKVSFNKQRYSIDDSWSVTTAAGLSKNDPALLSLSMNLKERFGLRLKTAAGNGTHNIHLSIKPGSVIIGHTTDTNHTALKQQAYNLKLEAGRISITANGGAGLFYGVQTLIQLLQQENGKTTFAGGEITDWPDMDLRMIYWDDAHHLERINAMKRAIKQASYYKINAFTVKLEGHFQFKTAKPVIEPYAYTPAEFQELTDYAKAHYVELVPYLDAPAHISFILKHPEYKDLRAFPNSNYEFSVLNPKADELMLGMFDDLMEANKGGKYLLFSTDEAYYVGKSEAEKKRAEALGGNGKLLAEFITRISNKLHAKGRKIIIWAEYPLTVSDINSIPLHIINGVYNNEWASKIKEHGMRQLIYTWVQGEEPLFPNYHKLPSKKALTANTAAHTDDEEQQGELSNGRVGEVLKDITSGVAAANADFMGIVVAGWGDAGLNPETFWLGYAAGTAAGWNNRSMTAKDLTNRFYNSFYGSKVANMDRVYQLLSTQAYFWDKSWDWQNSKLRTPIFGNSERVFDTAKPVKDQILPLLPVPSQNDLSLKNDWNDNNKDRLLSAEKYLKENDELMKLLNENLLNAEYQQYNLQVLRSVAQLCRHNLNMLLDLKRINDLLNLSSTLASGNPAIALLLIDQALSQVKKIRDERNDVLQAVTAIWYQDWYPRVEEANGRKFLDQADDVKDHLPARTVDMSYLIYRELKYPLGKWVEDVLNARNQFAKDHNLPLQTEIIDWSKF